MKVIVATLHREINFGSVLQAVALCRAIANLGHTAEVLDYSRSNRTGWSMLAHRYRTFRGSSLRRGFTAVEATVELSRAWEKRFEPFLRNFVALSPRYIGLADLQRKPPFADVLVTGSDQVWNTFYNGGVDSAFLLDFGSMHTRRVAYAASFGIEELPGKHEAVFRELLGRYARIGVREQEGVDLVQRLGLPAELVVDPTLLLDRPEWESIAGQPPDLVPDPYILVYCVEDERRALVAEMASGLARRTGWRIIHVAPGGRQDRIRGLSGNLRARPSDFLRLVADSSYVITSSFHGTAFSLIFGKQFASVTPPRFSNRAAGLLKALGIEDRLVDSTSTFESLGPVDLDQISARLGHLRSSSLKFLREAIEPS